MTNDMTHERPLTLLLRFMIPVCLGNFFQQFYNVADSIIAGRFLGVNALAAVGSTGPLIFLVIGWLNGLTSGFAVLVAQCFGAKKFDRMRQYIAMSVYLCVAVVVVMTAGLMATNNLVLSLLHTPGELFHDVAAYMNIIYAGLAVTAAYNGAAAVLRAIGDSRSPLYFLMISAVLNVVLDIVFIVWGGMGVEGCAWATVIAQAVSALLCLIFIFRRYDILKLKREDFRISLPDMRQLLAIGIPMGLQFSITAVGTLIVQWAVNGLGAVCIAAFSAAGKIQNLISSVYLAFGATIATYVSQNYGAGQIKRVKEGLKVTQLLVLVWSLMIFGLVMLFGRSATQLFIDGSETAVLDASAEYFRIVAWCYPFLGSIFLYRNALQGMGFGLVPMMGGIFELIARLVVVMVAVGPLGYRGVCMADPAAWLAALVPIVPFYFYQINKMGSHFRQNQL